MSYHSGLENQVSDWLLLFDDLKKRTVVFYPVLIFSGFRDLSLSRNRRLLSPSSRPLSHKVPKLEATRLGLLRTSKITRIDPIITKLCP